MLIAIFVTVFLSTKDLHTPFQDGLIDYEGRGTPLVHAPETFGSVCAHVNCGATPDPLLLRVVQCGHDVVITAESTDTLACASFEE